MSGLNKVWEVVFLFMKQLITHIFPWTAFKMFRCFLERGWVRSSTFIIVTITIFVNMITIIAIRMYITIFIIRISILVDCSPQCTRSLCSGQGWHTCSTGSSIDCKWSERSSSWWKSWWWRWRSWVTCGSKMTPTGQDCRYALPGCYRHHHRHSYHRYHWNQCHHNHHRYHWHHHYHHDTATSNITFSAVPEVLATLIGWQDSWLILFPSFCQKFLR